LLVVDILVETNDPSLPITAYNKFKEKNPKNIAALSLLLGKLKYEPAIKDIEEILLNSQMPDREIIAQSLGWMQNKSVIPTLIQVLQEKEGEGRYGAAWSLGVLEAKEALPYLLKTAQSNDRKLAILSIEALGHIKSSEALPVLEKLAQSPTTQIYALNTIGEISDPKAIEILKKYAKQKGEISHIAIEVLSKRPEPVVIDILIEILKETDTEDIKAKILYGALQRKTKKDYISKNQWLQWYDIEYQKK
jgi:FOG: HEAT repeat